MDKNADKNELQFEYTLVTHSPLTPVPESPTLRYFLYQIATLNPCQDAVEEFLTWNISESGYDENDKYKDTMKKVKETFQAYEKLFTFYERGITVDLRCLSERDLKWIKEYLVDVEAFLKYYKRIVAANRGLKQNEMRNICDLLNSLNDLRRSCPNPVERV